MQTLEKQPPELPAVSRRDAAPRPGLVGRAAGRLRWEWSEFQTPSRATFIQEELDRSLLEEIVWHAGERVLDVGCARGHYMTALARKGVRATGVDLSQELLVDAKRSGHLAIRATGDRLPFGDAAFETILCHKTMHLFAEPHQAIREFQRVLTPGGRVIFSTSNAASPYARIQAASLAARPNDNWGYGNRWSVSDWQREFGEHGMATRSIYSCNLIWPLVYRVCDRWLIPNEWMRRYSRWVRRVSGIPLRTTYPLGAAQDYLVEVVKQA